MCIKINSIFVNAARSTRVLLVAFISIYMGYVIAEPINANNEEVQYDVTESSDFFTNQKIANGFRISEGLLGQQSLIALPSVVFQLDTAETSLDHAAYEVLTLPKNNSLAGRAGSLKAISKASKPSFGLPERIKETNTQQLSEEFSDVELEDLTYQLSNRAFSSLILMGVGLISFCCLRFKMRRVDAVKA